MQMRWHFAGATANHIEWHSWFRPRIQVTGKNPPSEWQCISNRLCTDKGFYKRILGYHKSRIGRWHDVFIPLRRGRTRKKLCILGTSRSRTTINHPATLTYTLLNLPSSRAPWTQQIEVFARHEPPTIIKLTSSAPSWPLQITIPRPLNFRAGTLRS